MTLDRPTADCKNLARQLEGALRPVANQSFQAPDFSLDFVPRPYWQQLLDSERLLDLMRHISVETQGGGCGGCHTIVDGKLMALVIRPHKPTVLSHRLVGAIKQGADQCTGEKPSVI